jgi:hypothetical protein
MRGLGSERQRMTTREREARNGGRDEGTAQQKKEKTETNDFSIFKAEVFVVNEFASVQSPIFNIILQIIFISASQSLFLLFLPNDKDHKRRIRDANRKQIQVLLGLL